jgi:predicted transposase YbfD/YdcC
MMSYPSQKRWRDIIMVTTTASIAEHFGCLEDPRAEHLIDHKLIDIIVIAICAVICSAETWDDIELFGNERIEWLEQFLELKHGIPSHDTFGRVFARIDSEQFQSCFISWVQAVFEATQGQVIAVDGKQARRSHDRSQGKPAIHVVSAWAGANHLVLGQQTVDEKSNEITAIPELLRLLEISGCIVTIDAMGCQREIAQLIVDQGADYVLAVKGNQGQLYEDIDLFFRLAQQHGFERVEHTYERTVNKGHGRIEIRECWAIAGAESLHFLRDHRRWQGLQTMAMVHSQRQINGATTVERRYYISSLANDARKILHAARSHWGVENSLHWVLDVAMGEDNSRIRKDNAPENMATLRRLTLNLLKQEKSLKRGIQGKRLKAALSPDYLLKVLTV